MLTNILSGSIVSQTTKQTGDPAGTAPQQTTALLDTEAARSASTSVASPTPTPTPTSLTTVTSEPSEAETAAAASQDRQASESSTKAQAAIASAASDAPRRAAIGAPAPGDIMQSAGDGTEATRASAEAARSAAIRDTAIAGVTAASEIAVPDLVAKVEPAPEAGPVRRAYAEAGDAVEPRAERKADSRV
ncbi:hypothetical protein LX81_00406 [Palleronia aestuarii]|uniref:Uncharacterized protein n=1 Tax=Palleronia aestuarii TaxID=568105 RepID=A0A2W7P9A6_9RHOB|nr:hypothetical protein [Palleronia aestuarii]PZX19942.1 hypothetical protein LX81_00406 [Palleronia aestuarii]